MLSKPLLDLRHYNIAFGKCALSLANTREPFAPGLHADVRLLTSINVVKS